MPSHTRSGVVYGKDDRKAYNVVRPGYIESWSPDDVVSHVGRVLGGYKQDPGKQRRHWVYSAEGKSLVVVSIRKNMWGLVLVHENGRVQKGQYVRHHKFHHQHSAFDGRHFYWDVYYPATWTFLLGKSFAPYWTAIHPVEDMDGWHRKYWGMASMAAGIMYDLSEIEWTPLAPPPGYPKFRGTPKMLFKDSYLGEQAMIRRAAEKDAAVAANNEE